jgi:hypothetical protein
MQIKTSIRKSLSAFLLLAGLTAATVSCKKDKNDDGGTPPPPPAAAKLKEFKTGEEFIRFEYNASGSVTKVTMKNDVTTGDATEVFNVLYAGNKITSLESNSQKFVPVYENNVITKADIFQDNEKVGYTTYQYENGSLKKATIHAGEANQFIAVLEFIFTYASGNITEMQTMMLDGESGQMVHAGHITYQYDQKSNPLFAQKDLLVLFWLSPSKNNVAVENHFDANQQPEDKFVYNYTYNNNGLPKSAVVTQGLPGQPTTTENVEYIY